MRCLGWAVTVGIVAVVLTASLALAGPVFYSGGPTPDRQVLDRCRGPAGAEPTPSAAASSSEPEPSAAPGPVKSLAPTIVSGGQWTWPAPAAAARDASWCGGAYRRDAGTNFGGS